MLKKESIFKHVLPEKRKKKVINAPFPKGSNKVYKG